MIFSKVEKLLRTSKRSCLTAHVYIKESNLDWFTDTLFQEMLIAIKPSLPTKITECRQGKKAVSVFKNRAFQLAYFVDKGDMPASQLLLQEPRVKEEDEADEEQSGSELQKNLFSYQGLRVTRNVLVLVPEPFDANNSVDLPTALGVCIE
ncbi:hypothetical protein FB645_001169 [Coemansia sp. IMI 203386]|nr:hypothetical protein FB645_001169 [Coemansia sp. IMI 203386]